LLYNSSSIEFPAGKQVMTGSDWLLNLVENSRNIATMALGPVQYSPSRTLLVYLAIEILG
jgi:hypothetical protein